MFPYCNAQSVSTRCVFPSAWKKLDELAAEEIVISSELVLFELESQDDYVTVWAKAHSPNFLPLDTAVQLQAKEILKSHKNLVDLKRRKSSADPFIIALAMTSACTVVTEEKPSGGPPKI